MNYSLKKILLGAIFLLAVLPLTSNARLGVGVGSGKIQVDGKLKPGGFYELPLLPVLNTGDIPANYALGIEYNETQPEKRPEKTWFEFRPATFHLEPGKVQPVKIIVNIPIKAIPGDYFAYLEAHPVASPEAGVTSVGIAAASKLYFTVAPANFLQGVYYKLSFLFQKYTPWSWVVLGILFLIILITTFKSKFNLQISLAKK